jgi:uncharacterized membrane protein
VWVRTSSAAISAAGVAVAVYLLIERLTTTKALVCPEGSVVNCQKVTQSAQSVFLGVPVTVWGLAFFIGMLALTLPFAWRSGVAWVSPLRIGSAAAGVAFVLYLIYVELFELNAICLWCTAVHVLTIALFAVLAIGLAMAE